MGAPHKLLEHRLLALLSPRPPLPPRLTGFSHAAFTFGYEASVNKIKMNANDVPPGSLITFIQKGMQYLELEANLNDSATGDPP